MLGSVSEASVSGLLRISGGEGGGDAGFSQTGL